MVSTRCPNPQCMKAFSVKEESFGKKARCPACHQVFIISPDAKTNISMQPVEDNQQTTPAPSSSQLRPDQQKSEDTLQQRKSKTTAGLLGILLGGLGIHKFYLGTWGWGIVYILLSWTFLPSIIGLIEGIIYLIMSEEMFDEKYNRQSFSSIKHHTSVASLETQEQEASPNLPLSGKMKNKITGSNETEGVDQSSSTEHNETPKSLFGKLRESFQTHAQKAKTYNICSQCGSKMTMFEISAKMGKCSRCALVDLGLATSSSAGYDFSQAASYRGGLPEFPEQGKRQGFAFIFEDFVCFFDDHVRWKMPYEKVLKAELDFFQPSGLRAVLAGTNALVLQRTRNYVAITFEKDGTEHTVKFQIHGALSIPGEENNATEFLNHMLTYKKKFMQANGTPQTTEDIPSKLQKLAELNKQGVISDNEYEAKRKELLSRM